VDASDFLFTAKVGYQRPLGFQQISVVDLELIGAMDQREVETRNDLARCMEFVSQYWQSRADIKGI